MITAKRFLTTLPITCDRILCRHLISNSRSTCRQSHSHQTSTVIVATVNDQITESKQNSDKQFIISSNTPYSSSSSSVNAYTNRTHHCGELRKDHVGHQVTLVGWLQHQRLGKFLILRDSYGQIQLTIQDEELKQRFQLSSGVNIQKLSYESVLKVTGQVIARPLDQVNLKLKTGEVEVEVKQLQLLNRCSMKLPFTVRDAHKVNEQLRLKHRYLDLRSISMQQTLRLRSDFLIDLRLMLSKKLGFVEVETPTLFKRTPGGAQEFCVPSRNRGRFYSLTQSPQQFKQLLMIGGLDRYFQIARCYRDETTRSDRQPEFTQVDLELSFTTAEHVQKMVENLLIGCWPTKLHNITAPFPRLTYTDAMQQYGSDKPDLRLDVKLQKLPITNQSTNRLKISTFKISGANHFEEGQTLALNDLARKLLKQYNLENAAHLQVFHSFPCVTSLITSVQCLDEENLAGFSDQEREEAGKRIKLFIEKEQNSAFWFVAGRDEQTHDFLGRLRNEFVPTLLTNSDVSLANGLSKEKYAFAWIVDFPLFLPKSNSIDGHGKPDLESTHHPFTAPVDKHQKLVYTQPDQVTGQHFDLVLNGKEVAGGSIRIHDPDLQRYVFESVLKEPCKSMDYFVQALSAGCPPHGGIALGVDRLISLMLNQDSIRDVIAFPKAMNGRDPMTGAPSSIDSQTKKLYHLY